MVLARQAELTEYDAAYLEVVDTPGDCRLATLERRELRRSAQSKPGVALRFMLEASTKDSSKLEQSR